MRVFLSHATESDGPLARRLSQDLEDRGIATWLAPRDVDPGVTWAHAVEAGLRACTHVAVLVTASASRSRTVHQELRVAEMLRLDERVVVLPLLLGTAEPPPSLRAVPGIDFTGGHADGLDALAAAVRRSTPAAAPAGDGERVIAHRVRRGDRIDLLAAHYLGEPARWRVIADDNPGLDVSALEPGTLVSIRARGR